MPIRCLSALSACFLLCAAGAAAQQLSPEAMEQASAVGTAAAQERCQAVAGFDAAALDREEVVAASDYRRALGRELVARFQRHVQVGDYARLLLAAALDSGAYEESREIQSATLEKVGELIAALETQRTAVEALEPLLTQPLVSSAEEEQIRATSGAVEEALRPFEELLTARELTNPHRPLGLVENADPLRSAEVLVAKDLVLAALARHEQAMADFALEFAYHFELQFCIEDRRAALSAEGGTVEAAAGGVPRPLDLQYPGYGKAIGSFRLDLYDGKGSYWDGEIDLRIAPDGRTVVGLLMIPIGSSWQFQQIAGVVDEERLTGSVVIFDWEDLEARIEGSLYEHPNRPGEWHGSGSIRLDESDIAKARNPSGIRLTGANGSWETTLD